MTGTRGCQAENPRSGGFVRLHGFERSAPKFGADSRSSDMRGRLEVPAKAAREGRDRDAAKSPWRMESSTMRIFSAVTESRSRAA